MNCQMNSNCCPICFDELKLDMIVFLDTCHHGFCKSCARELLMHDEFPYVQCPVDKIQSDHLGHYNKPRNVFNSNQYLYVNETTHDYLKHDIENDPDYFTSDTENRLSECIILCNEAIHYFTVKLNMFKQTLEQVNDIVVNSHCENSAMKKIDVYNEIEKLNLELENKIHSLKEINCAHYTKYDILLEFVSDRNDNGESLFDVNNIICILMQQYLSIFKKFISEHFRYFNEPDIFTNTFYTNSILAVDKEITIMKDLSMYLTMISVSYLNDSKYLYKMIQPQIKEITFKTCLICVNKIHGNHYGRFKKCEHKLCMNCVKSLWILEGHCPLDGDTTNRLEIVTIQSPNILNALFHNHMKISDSPSTVKYRSPFSYLVEKFEKYSVRNFDEVFLYIVEKIKEIKSVLVDSLNLLMDLQILLEEDSKIHKDRILIKDTKLSIIHILKNTENNKFRYNDSISLMKFYGFLASYRIMDSKCQKCHTFDAILEERIEEFMITLEELIPFKKWLSTFEHLVDAVCLFMNNPECPDNAMRIKEIIQEFIEAFECIFYSYVNPAEEHCYSSTANKFHALGSFIEAKRQLDRKFEKYRNIFEAIKENSDNDFQ